MTNVEILYGEDALAELPDEALVIMQQSPAFMGGQSIIALDEDQGVWQEKAIVHADAELLPGIVITALCLTGAIMAPIGYIAAIADRIAGSSSYFTATLKSFSIILVASSSLAAFYGCVTLPFSAYN